MDAADQAHDRRRVPRLPARRLLQPGRRPDRAGHPAGRHDDRGGRHAVPVRPRPRAAERALRPGRGRQAARGLPPAARRLHPDRGPTRCSTRRSTLLERITAEPGKAPLLEAIGDGTFGLMKRPADRGKGYDGVVTQGDGYWNPATEILEGRGSEQHAGTTKPRDDDRPALRRHHRRRHGADVVHPAGAARQAGRGRGAAAGRTRWAWTRRCWCTPRRWAPTSPSSSSTAR